MLKTAILKLKEKIMSEKFNQTKSVEQLAEKYIQTHLKTVNEKFEEFIKKIEEKGQFDEVMSRVAKQENWDGESYGGDMSDLRFAGGFSEHVLSNIIYELGLSKLDKDARIIILKKAVEENPKIKLFVDSVIAATKVVDSKKKENLKDIAERHGREIYDTQGEDIEKIIYSE